MNERAKRIGENEALFRDVNERVREVNESFSLLLEEMDLVCECGTLECTERMHMTVERYEQIRSDPALFAIRPGHEFPDVEYVVDTGGDYVVVRKREGVAAETDPPS